MEVGEVCDEDNVCDMLPDGSNVRQFIQQYQNGELKFYVKAGYFPCEKLLILYVECRATRGKQRPSENCNWKHIQKYSS